MADRDLQIRGGGGPGGEGGHPDPEIRRNRLFSSTFCMCNSMCFVTNRGHKPFLVLLGDRTSYSYFKTLLHSLGTRMDSSNNSYSWVEERASKRA